MIGEREKVNELRQPKANTTYSDNFIGNTLGFSFTFFEVGCTSIQFSGINVLVKTSFDTK